jgi:glycolate oxidase FAD binding subunit
MESPVKAAAPRSVEDLAQILAQCNAERSPVSIEGGGTLRAMGSPGVRGVPVSMLKLNRLIAHERHDLTCALQAGMTLARLAESLAEHGQFVPIDAPLRRKATVGGTFAAGWLGPRRHLYGRPRDLAIGSEVLFADGTLARAGGMVVKNVSGYDMTKLYAGSFGTLAAIVRLNFKTMPLPQKRRLLLATLPERSRSRAIAQVGSLPLAIAAAVCVEGFRKSIDGADGVDGRMLIFLEGSEALLDRATLEVRSALGRAGVPETTIVETGARESFERVLDAPITSIGERSLTYRLLGPPSTAEDRASSVRDAANRRKLFTEVLLDAMNGDVYLRVSDRDSRAFSEKIEDCDDEIAQIDPFRTIVAGDGPIRGSLAGWGAEPPAIAKMRELKARFDPNGTLNPRRYIGGL